MLQSIHLAYAQVMHRRLSPKVNHFNYHSRYIVLPIAQYDNLRNRLFSLSGFNLFALHHKNYGDISRTYHSFADVVAWVKQTFSDNGIDASQQLLLVTHPTVLGYAFNPVSFWLCFNASEQLQAVLCEVNNTVGQRHFYLCSKDDGSSITENDWLQADKAFYVSPFLAIEGTYAFRFRLSKQQMQFCINHFQDQKLKLATSLKCDLRPYNTTTLLRCFVGMPWVTFKTTLLIHYQALRLLLKSIRYFSPPKALAHNITKTDAKTNSKTP